MSARCIIHASLPAFVHRTHIVKKKKEKKQTVSALRTSVRGTMRHGSALNIQHLRTGTWHLVSGAASTHHDLQLCLL